MPDARVEAIRPHVSSQVWDLVRLQRLTGMRSGEACIMRSGDLDRSGAVWAYSPASHKTEHHGHGRVIYLGPRAQEVVRPWLRADPNAYLFQPREAEAERLAGRRARRATPMTPSQRTRSRKARPKKAPGDRYDSRSYGHAIAGVRPGVHAPDAVGGPPEGPFGGQREEFGAWRKAQRSRPRSSGPGPARREEFGAWRKAQRRHPHQLRHSSATSLRKEFGLEVARIVLGHTSPAVTELYAEAYRAKAVAAMEQIG